MALILGTNSTDFLFGGAPGQVRTFSDGTDTYVLLNTDKDIDAEAMIRVLGVHTVDAGWFVL